MVDKEAEEEQYRDLTLLMELLTNLLSKDFIDLSPADSGETVEEVMPPIRTISWTVSKTSMFFTPSKGCDGCRRVLIGAEHNHASYVCRAAEIP